MSKTIRIDIFDQSYNLRGDDERYVQQLAAYVDDTLHPGCAIGSESTVAC